MENDVQSVLNEMKNKKSTGHEGINNFILKNISGSILKPLCTFMNMSLVSGYVADIVKRILKNKTFNNRCSYRDCPRYFIGLNRGPRCCNKLLENIKNT